MARNSGTTIFAEMSALAAATGAINLGQGFPDSDGPREVLDAAHEAIDAGRNQYPLANGTPELTAAIAAHQRHWYGLEHDPESEIIVTVGATEAVSATLLALCERGDEVVVLDPAYDSYGAAARLAGARLVPVPLRPPAQRLDPGELSAAIGPQTRLLLINTPHNPTGRVLDAAEREAIAAVANKHDLTVVCDEVYEHLCFDGREHVPLATLPGMAERTVTISSAGKTFSVTGWKIGWACGPARLIAQIGAVKQYLTFASGGPFQIGVAAGLGLDDRRFAAICAGLQARRDQLVAGIEAAGIDVLPCEATYFVTADTASLGVTDGEAFCRELPHRCGVVAIPSAVFYADPGPARTLVRFACCKRPEVLAEAAERLAGLRS